MFCKQSLMCGFGAKLSTISVRYPDVSENVSVSKFLIMTTETSSRNAGLADAEVRSDLDNYCRICLLRKDQLVSLTSEFNGVLIPEMLWKVCGTMLNALEQFPRVICQQCLTKLDLSYNIALEFKKQEELLRSFCWKGALVEQLENHQQSELASKKQYSDTILRQLAEEHAKAKSEDEASRIIEQSPKDKDDDVTEVLVERLDDVAEEASYESSDHFDLIVEEEEISKSDTDQDRNEEVDKLDIKEEPEIDSDRDCPTPPGTIRVELISAEEAARQKLVRAQSTRGKQSEDDDEIVQYDLEEDDDEDSDENDSVEDLIEYVDVNALKRGSTGRSTGKRKTRGESNEEGNFDCNECGKVFTVRKTFLNHVRMHENVKEKTFQCPKCTKVFATKERLTRHHALHERDLTCQQCGHVSENGYQYKAHDFSHRKGLFKCVRCGFPFSSKKALEAHQKLEECDRPIEKKRHKYVFKKDTKCPYEGCDYRADTYGAMYVHKRAKHQQQFPCDLCEKRFAFANQLKQHRTIHTGEKPFRCELCMKSFRRMYSYKEHMAIHQNSNTYDCEQCGKKFNRPRYLAAHMLTHTEERPFACSICSSRYKSNGELTKHVRAKHDKLEFDTGTDMIEEDYDYFEDDIML
ncbi:zinc finger protein 82 homolog isoform X2 [Uranotaenia lowii]|uniref:zinc finger protein 82 homolog isoform X2 n=1 Tax=Uranotaenia lowii TaxID=190385 RepID=UPI00247A0AF0|nr:zinc finger protein 82 homolog isoform X2 [Uranotaenia lowii]